MSDYDPFDDFSDDEPDDDDLAGEIEIDPFQRYLEDNGIASVDDVIIDIDNVDLSELRGTRFGTLEEAVTFLIEVGLITFSNIVLIDDLYGIVVYDSGPPTAPPS